MYCLQSKLDVMHLKLITAALLLPLSVLAQNMVKVDHLLGSAGVGDNSVTVTAVGDPSNCVFNEIGPYRIGNKGLLNGYNFDFGKPVHAIQLHFSAFDIGERVAIEVDGQRYHPQIQDILTKGMRIREDGAMELANDVVIPQTISIVIAPQTAIRSVFVHHLNGLNAGAVFDMYIDGKAVTGPGKVTTSSNDLEAMFDGRLSVYPNPATGTVMITGMVDNDDEQLLEIVNELGQRVYEERITPHNRLVNVQVSLSGSIANGLYSVSLGDGSHTRHAKFSLSR